MSTKQQAFRDLGGTTSTFNGDIIAGCLADEPTISAKNINGILYEWLGLKGYTQDSLPSRQQAFAEDRGASNWTSLRDWHVELITNGGFDTDSDWTKLSGNPNGWTIASGVASCDGLQTEQTHLAQTTTVVDGLSYVMTFTVSNIVSGVARLQFNGVGGAARSTNGTFSETLIAGANSQVLVTGSVGFVGDVDNVSVVRAP